MWEVWEVMLMTQIQVMQAFTDLIKTYAAQRKGAWPPGFAVFSSDAAVDEPMTTRLYLSPAAAELTRAWPANSFTRCGTADVIPMPYESLFSHDKETDPLVCNALAGVS